MGHGSKAIIRNVLCILLKVDEVHDRSLGMRSGFVMHVGKNTQPSFEGDTFVSFLPWGMFANKWLNMQFPPIIYIKNT